MMPRLLILALAGAAFAGGCRKPPAAAAPKEDSVKMAPISQREDAASDVKTGALETATFALG